MNNPFYCGIILYRKEYVPDYLEQKKVKNWGEVEQIAVEGSHEPIVTKEEFEKVAEEKHIEEIIPIINIDAKQRYKV